MSENREHIPTLSPEEVRTELRADRAITMNDIAYLAGTRDSIVVQSMGAVLSLAAASVAVASLHLGVIASAALAIATPIVAFAFILFWWQKRIKISQDQAHVEAIEAKLMRGWPTDDTPLLFQTWNRSEKSTHTRLVQLIVLVIMAGLSLFPTILLLVTIF